MRGIFFFRPRPRSGGPAPAPVRRPGPGLGASGGPAPAPSPGPAPAPSPPRPRRVRRPGPGPGPGGGRGGGEEGGSAPFLSGGGGWFSTHTAARGGEVVVWVSHFVLSNPIFFFIFQFIMYQINFNDPKNNKINIVSQTLECKGFSKKLYQSPSDRHAYSAKFFSTPIRYF